MSIPPDRFRIWARAIQFGMIGALAGAGTAIGLAVSGVLPAKLAGIYGVEFPLLGAVVGAGGWLWWSCRGLFR